MEPPTRPTDVVNRTLRGRDSDAVAEWIVARRRRFGALRRDTAGETGPDHRRSVDVALSLEIGNIADAWWRHGTHHRDVFQRTTTLALAMALVVAAAGCSTPQRASQIAPRVAPPASGPSASASAPASEPDKCVFGSWTVTGATSHEIVNDDVVEFTNKGGGEWHFNPDGTGRYDFGRGTTYTASHGGNRIAIEYRGGVTFTYSFAVGHQLKLENLRSDAESAELVWVGDTSVWTRIATMPYSIGHHCAVNSLDLGNEVESLQLRRVLAS